MRTKNIYWGLTAGCWMLIAAFGVLWFQDHPAHSGAINCVQWRLRSRISCNAGPTCTGYGDDYYSTAAWCSSQFGADWMEATSVACNEYGSEIVSSIGLNPYEGYETGFFNMDFCFKVTPVNE